MDTVKRNLSHRLLAWLQRDITPPRSFPLSDFQRIQYEIQLCDVLLIEGRSHISHMIQRITKSPWSHAALYIGRLSDITDLKLRALVQKHYAGDLNQQLILESVLDKGIIISPLSTYQHEHLRICRPNGIAPLDVQAVIVHSVARVGTQYDIKQVISLYFFLHHWRILPSRLYGNLLHYQTKAPLRAICSSVIAEAFQAVNFPILPILNNKDANNVMLMQRNPKLYTPSDFDFSPFFDIVKYPIIHLSKTKSYRDLPWESGVVSNDDGKPVMTNLEEVEAQLKLAKQFAKKPVRKQPTKDFFD